MNSDTTDMGCGPSSISSHSPTILTSRSPPVCDGTKSTATAATARETTRAARSGNIYRERVLSELQVRSETPLSGGILSRDDSTEPTETTVVFGVEGEMPTLPLGSKQKRFRKRLARVRVRELTVQNCSSASMELSSRASTFPKRDGDFSTSFRILRCIGCGAYGEVFLVQERDGQKETFAVKKINLKNADKDSKLEEKITSEIDLQQGLCHPNVVGFHGFFREEDIFYLIFEHASGGSLEELLDKLYPLTFGEQGIASVLVDILGGIAYLHSRGVAHRDLKPANILLLEDRSTASCGNLSWASTSATQSTYFQRAVSGDSDWLSDEAAVPNGLHFAIGDFGFGKRIPNSSTAMMTSFVGSPLYMAPEIVRCRYGASKSHSPSAKPAFVESSKQGAIAPPLSQQRREAYSAKCDMWSIGVIAYELFYGEMPFNGQSSRDLLRNVARGNIVIPPTRMRSVQDGADTHWKEEPVSVAFRDFLSRLLQRDPAKRATASEALRHPLFTNNGFGERVQQKLRMAQRS